MIIKNGNLAPLGSLFGVLLNAFILFFAHLVSKYMHSIRNINIEEARQTH